MYKLPTVCTLYNRQTVYVLYNLPTVCTNFQRYVQPAHGMYTTWHQYVRTLYNLPTVCMYIV